MRVDQDHTAMGEAASSAAKVLLRRLHDCPRVDDVPQPEGSLASESPIMLLTFDNSRDEQQGFARPVAC
jgi:hypothetical protein